MRHLHSDELIDIAEGTRPESSAPHLQRCDACRRQLAEVRAMRSAASEVDVPEPSPLFWEHFSARVHDAIVAEGSPRRFAWPEGWSWSRLALPVSIGACATLIIGTLLMAQLGRAPAEIAREGSPEVAESEASVDAAVLSSDPSLELVADLTEDMDWDRAREVGFAPREDAVEGAVNRLSDVERRELHRLLEKELVRSN